jgi:hypothetical protein
MHKYIANKKDSARKDVEFKPFFSGPCGTTFEVRGDNVYPALNTAR